jgi:TonB-dependent starch-binding outer membrane protein SusC
MSQTWLRRALGVALGAIALVALASPAFAQTGTIAVTVIDRTSSNPIDGARVYIPGTTVVRAISDGRGQASLTNVAPGTYTVQVLAIGYVTGSEQVTVTAGGTATLSFQLNLTAVSLDDIVVTGTGGPVEKKKIGTALGTVDVDAVRDIVPTQNIGTVLQARVPGVHSVGMSGGIGSARDLRIRGFSSFQQSQRPVVYIDGVRADNNQNNWSTAGTACCSFDGGAGNDRLDDINPDDIERIEVIKGAAAATLYGTEATNGVIQVFTKKGRANSRPRWSVRYGAGFNRLRENLPTTENPRFTGPDGTRAHDANELIQNGLIQQLDLSIQGGGPSTNYFIAGGFLYEEGSIQPNDMKRGNIRLNMAWTASDNWNFELTSGYVKNDTQLLQAGNNWTALLGNALLGNPLAATAERPFGEPWVAVSDIRKIQSSSNVDRWTGGATINFTPTPSFGHRLTFGVDNVGDRRERLHPFGSQYVYVGSDGERSVAVRDFTSYTMDYLGTLNFPVTGRIQSDFSFGAQGFWEFDRQSTAIGEGFAGAGVTTVTGAAVRSGRENFEETINVGLFAQDRFSFYDKLFFTVGARLDGNSAFGNNFGLQFYPKADAAYMITEGGQTLSSLRLRGAFGMSGLPPGAFDQFRTFSPLAVLDGENGVVPDNPGNADLEPEKTREIEGGFDLGMWNGRVSFEGTVYYSKTTDALLPVPLPPSQGFVNSRKANVGEIENKGWEAKFDILPVEGRSFRWNTTVVMSGNKNKILDLGPSAECNASGTECRLGNLRKGKAIGAQYNRTLVSYDPTTHTHTRSDTTEYIGDPLPSWEGSFINSFDFLNSFRLYFQFTWEKGAWFGNGDRPYQARQGAGDEYLSLINDDGTRTAQADSLLDYFTLFGSVDKRDNIRLGEVSLQYNVPASFTGKLGLGPSSLVLSGQNLMWWDDCNCRDPNGAWRAGTETTGGDEIAFGNSDFLSNPQPRRFVFTIRTTF